MKSFQDLYHYQLEYNVERMPYVGDFKCNPYSFLKARYYMFFSTLIVFFLQKTSIHPNNITKLYIFSGFLSATLLAVPISEAHYFAIFLIFSKGILDWADGFFARLKGKASLTGHVLDIYGANINSITFIVSLGIYEYFYFNESIYFLMTLFIYPFCYGTLLTKFSNQYILESINSKSFKSHVGTTKPAKSIKESHRGAFNFFSVFLDDRSRTIDFVLLLIVIEHFNGPALSWLFYVGVNLKWIALWIGSFIFSSKINYTDDVLSTKLNEIKNG
tara:strand:+ start:2158 stop:2979 length:822 start_codon:yes stop_codon:yes gene_type:complete